MDLITVMHRFKQKRRNLTVAKREINDILEDMQDDVGYEVGELVKTMKPITCFCEQKEGKCFKSKDGKLVNTDHLTIKKALKSANEIQSKINKQTIQIYENSKKIFALILG